MVATSRSTYPKNSRIVVNCFNRKSEEVVGEDPLPNLNLSSRSLSFRESSILAIAIACLTSIEWTKIFSAWTLLTASLVMHFAIAYRRTSSPPIRVAGYDDGKENEKLKAALVIQPSDLLRTSSVSICTFSICDIRILRHTSRSRKTVSEAELWEAEFGIKVTVGCQSWISWKTFNIFKSVCNQLLGKHEYSNLSLSKAKTVGYVRDAIFTDQHLTQLQRSILDGLEKMRKNSSIVDSTILRFFLDMPLQRALSAAGSSIHTNKKGKDITSGNRPKRRSVSFSSAPVAAGSSVSSIRNVSSAKEITSNGDGGYGSTATIAAAAAAAALAAKVGAPVPASSANWKGTSSADFEFLDESESAKDIYRDCSRTHDFNVRGPSYMRDRRKVFGGDAVGRLVLMELFEVEEKDGDRHDHIASRGRAKERVDIMASLSDSPFIFVLNIQIPGTPPVSVVSYFLIPSKLPMYAAPSASVDAASTGSDVSDDAKFRRLLEEFVELPATETERLAAWEEADTGVALTRRGHADSLAQGLAEETTIDSFAGVFGDESELENHSVKAIPSSTGSNSDHHNNQATKQRGGALSALWRRYRGRNNPSRSLSFDSNESGQSSRSSTPELKVSPSPSGTPTKKGMSRLYAIYKNAASGRLSPKASQHDRKTVVSSTSAQSKTNHNKLTSSSPPIPPLVAALVLPEAEARLRGKSPVGSLSPLPPIARARSPSFELAKPGDGGNGHITAPVPKASQKSSQKPSSWMTSSDITWPDASEPGAMPPSDFRNQRFKLIPCMTDGPWVVKMAVRSTPVLLGKKVVQRYFRGPRYMEVDVHVGSSAIASQIVGLCRGYAKSCVCNVACVIQGESEEELPERLLACVTIHKIDWDVRRRLD